MGPGARRWPAAARRTRRLPAEARTESPGPGSTGAAPPQAPALCSNSKFSRLGQWPEFAIEYRLGGATRIIVMKNPDGVSRGVKKTSVDGHEVADGAIPPVDDGKRHGVVVVMGKSGIGNR